VPKFTTPTPPPTTWQTYLTVTTVGADAQVALITAGVSHMVAD